MDIFRIARPQDVEQISAITSTAGNGLTTIPKSPTEVRAYIDDTARFLDHDETVNRILFVVETDGHIRGISGIIPTLGKDRPFYSFKKSAHTRRSKSLGLSVTHEMLQLSTEFDGDTELASIFLPPSQRGKGVGRLLSLGRLCFIYQHKTRFNNSLMADIRGWVNDEGQSPFWNGLTSKFISMSFDEADRMSNIDGDFLNDLMPSLPIMMNTLPPDVKVCSGRPHEQSQGALKLLLDVGFEHTDYCDVFDGGPSIRAKLDRTLIGQTAQKHTAEFATDHDKPILHFRGQADKFVASLGPNDNDMVNRFRRLSLNASDAIDPNQHWVAAAYSQSLPSNREQANAESLHNG